MNQPLGRGLLIAMAMLSTACLGPRIMPAPLERPQVGAGVLYTPRPASVTVSVKDERPADAVLSGGILGPNGDEGKGIYLAYRPETPDQLKQLLEGSAKEAVDAFGFTAGPAYSLEVKLKDSRIDMYRYSGFSPMNCVGYLHVETALKAPDGQVKTRLFKLAYFENTTPMMSMKEVAKEALSRILHQAVTESVVASLQDQFPGAADPAALAKALTAAQIAKEEVTAREIVFLLGLTGREDKATKDGLVTLYQTSKSQRVRQGAMEAMGLMGATSQMDEIQDALTGKKPLASWDIKDTEEVWYMTKALHLLGAKDLSAKIPTSGLSGGQRLAHLLDFLASGKIPALSEVETQELQKARQAGN